MELHPIIIFIAGLVVIILGSEMLLRGATRVALMLRVSPIIIGLTIVSIGTSTPELAVGITAAVEGKGALAVGNIAGTNIFNILFILGLSALIRPLPTRLLSVKLDVPVMIASALALIIMSIDGVLSQTEGALMVLAAIFYTITLIRLSRLETASMRQQFSNEFSSESIPPRQAFIKETWNIFLLLIGMAVTVLGAELLVAGAVNIAQAYGVSDTLIGLTIVAMGTSAPELATTLLATYKNDRDVAIGNLIGSSIYNILAILGLTLLVAPGGIEVSKEILLIDLPLMAVVALVCLPVFKSDRCVSRREGAFFAIAYLVYLTTLVFIRN